ncbi:MAG: hypothetical protein AAB445_03445 [Patescibacteria group bacterium]
MENSTIGNTRDSEYLRVVADITTKLANGSLTLESAKLYAKKQNPFATPTRLTVDGSNPRWQSIRTEDYYYVNARLSVADFPVALATREVEYDVRTFDHDPTTQEVVDWQNEPGFRPLDRAESETYLDTVPDTKSDLGKSPIVCLCTVFGGHVAFVGLSGGGGRSLDRNQLDYRWNRSYRFVRARKSEL